MKTSPHTTLGEIMQDARLPAAHTVKRAWKLHRLTALVRRYLPQAAQPHCVVANVRGETLILLTDSPAWSARLRYQATQIRNALARDHGLALAAVRVHVSPTGANPSDRPARPAPRLGPANARLLQQQADVTDHPALSAALRRLARHGSS